MVKVVTASKSRCRTMGGKECKKVTPGKWDVGGKVGDVGIIWSPTRTRFG